MVLKSHFHEQGLARAEHLEYSLVESQIAMQDLNCFSGEVSILFQANDGDCDSEEVLGCRVRATFR